MKLKYMLAYAYCQ